MGEVRTIDSVTPGIPASDGAGVKLTRMIGAGRLPEADPFLLLDQIRSEDSADYIAGFPEHPHRGFETVTIMIDGKMRHGDNKGHAGVIGPGGVQWMTAGRGIVHSERPEQTEGRLWGFQLWINLPSTEKMTAPRYQEFSAERIPVDQREGAIARLFAGSLSTGVRGPAASAATDPTLFDLILDSGARFEEPLTDGYTVVVAVYAGSVKAQNADGRETVIRDPNLALMGRQGDLVLTAGDEGARCLVIAAKPLNEPIARMGPFVMNTQAELQQAVVDYQAGRF